MSKSDYAFWTLLALTIVLVLLPPRWDPAVRIKEWQIRRWGDRW